MHTCISSHGLKRSWRSCPRRVNAGNKNTPSTHHPQRRNVTTLMVGLKNGQYAKISPKSGEPQRYSWGTHTHTHKKRGGGGGGGFFCPLPNPGQWWPPYSPPVMLLLALLVLPRLRPVQNKRSSVKPGPQGKTTPYRTAHHTTPQLNQPLTVALIPKLPFPPPSQTHSTVKTSTLFFRLLHSQQHLQSDTSPCPRPCFHWQRASYDVFTRYLHVYTAYICCLMDQYAQQLLLITCGKC